MFERIKIQEMDDFFIDRDGRREKGVYIYRITSYWPEVREFIRRYYEEARQNGVVIEGGIANPDRRNLAYYEEMMGLDFQLSLGFLLTSLHRWLPRMNENQRKLVGTAMYDTLAQLQREGKNQGILKNAYIKFMCWLYYKFERIVNRLGDKKLPKILYEGKLSRYELLLLSILSKAGSDIVLLLAQGEEEYRRIDRESVFSDRLEWPGSKTAGEEGRRIGEAETVREKGRRIGEAGTENGREGAFPPDFSLKELQKEIALKQRRERLYGTRSRMVNVTNTWMEVQGQSDREMKDILIPFSRRREMACPESERIYFYNCFYQINGVEDKLTYLQELYQLQMQVKSSQRPLLILEGKIPAPAPEEIQNIQRVNGGTAEEILHSLCQNIRYPGDMELQRHMVTVFLDLMLETADADKRQGDTPQAAGSCLMNQGVQLLCWIQRYQYLFVGEWGDAVGQSNRDCYAYGSDDEQKPDASKMPGCMLYLGGCRNEEEELFIRFMARMPVDVLLFNPEKRQGRTPEDGLLCCIDYDEVMKAEKYPKESTDLRLGTAAYHAEQELDSILYQDSGMYRDRQYSKSTVITLQTMYEEIEILWDQELKYRPNFDIVQDVVNIPVLFAKVSGVKDGAVSKYWAGIRGMVTEDTLAVKNGPYVLPGEIDKVMPRAQAWLRDGKLLRANIREDKDYPYGFLREELQEYLLDKLQLLLDQKCIRGTYENGTEYTIISVALTLTMDILRLAQRFDLTKKNPKLIYVCSTERVLSLEDSILAAYLHLVGFDVLFFVPTGYQTVERHFQGGLLEEHQAGEYMYDLRVPELPRGAAKTRKGWLDKLFNW